MRIWVVSAFLLSGASMMFACGDSKSTTGTTSATSTSTSTTSTTTSSSTGSSSSSGAGGTGSSSSSGAGGTVSCNKTMMNPDCNTCCATGYPAELMAFEIDLYKECGGCTTPGMKPMDMTAPCAAMCVDAMGNCLDQTKAQDPMGDCYKCLQMEIGKGAGSQCVLKTITGDCTKDCPNFSGCIVGCNT